MDTQYYRQSADFKIAYSVLFFFTIYIQTGVALAVCDHTFNYDAETGTFKLKHNIVSVEDVQRDLFGSLCSKCHTQELNEVKASVHYTLQAPNQRIMFPGGGAHGMLDRACGLPGTSALINYTSDINLGECSKCHIGRFMPPMEAAFSSMFSQMGITDASTQVRHLFNAGIDCLICHSAEYSAVPEGTIAAGYAQPGDASPIASGYARAARDNTDFNLDGLPDLLIDSDGDGVSDMPLMFDSDGDGIPDTPWQTVAQDRSPEAIMSIGRTTEATCLRCHEHARTGYKRATMFAEGYDVHASVDSGPFEGASNRCTVCHRVVDIDADGDTDHLFVRGHSVGGDLAASDFPPPPAGTPIDPDDPTELTCIQCHEGILDDEHEVGSNPHSERHLSAIACETCHINLSGGITYSVHGHGGHVAFGRNEKGEDAKLITKDHMVVENHDDLATDLAAYLMKPTLMWFNGGTSFLAQPLAVRGSPNARITPFKPMANGMVFDARFFDGETMTNDVGIDYNAYSMYRFYANSEPDCVAPVCGNAEVFSALGLLDLTPEETRSITLMDFMSDDPNRQTMAMMQIFPNLVQFDKQTFGYEHYLIGTGSPYDLDEDGYLDYGQEFMFDMLAAANVGLQKFKGFNIPMMLPDDYQWYPPFDSPRQVITMKLPDGSLMKMFLQMQAASLPEEERAAYLAAVDNYPAFSNGITLGGHGVQPKENALGASMNGCLDCHGEDGVMETPIPVTRKVPIEMPGLGTLEMPTYRWVFYHVRHLANRGIRVENDHIASGLIDIDVLNDPRYVRSSDKSFVINWFMPDAPGGYLPADDSEVLASVDLVSRSLTWKDGVWMPVLEPVVDYVPNYAVLGYERSEIIQQTPNVMSAEYFPATVDSSARIKVLINEFDRDPDTKLQLRNAVTKQLYGDAKQRDENNYKVGWLINVDDWPDVPCAIQAADMDDSVIFGDWTPLSNPEQVPGGCIGDIEESL